MGDPVPDSMYAATILQNVPESWRSIAQTIQMIHTDVDQIEEKLEVHEADLNALEISTHATSAFTARSTLHSQTNVSNLKSSNHQRPMGGFISRSTYPRMAFVCMNCRRQGHTIVRCFARGGGMEGQAPWDNQSAPNLPKKDSPSPQMQNQTVNQSMSNLPKNSARLAEQKKANIIMMAHISEVKSKEKPNVTVSTNTFGFTSMEENTHLWFVDSAASSHICGNKNIFDTMYSVPNLTIETASGESFTANKRGTIKIIIQSGHTTTS